MLGGVAFLLMTASILLSTRLAIFEDMFGGLDRIYQVHRTAGVIASIFVLWISLPRPKNYPQAQTQLQMLWFHRHPWACWP